MTDLHTLGVLGEMDLDQMVEIHNQIRGVRPVTRLTDLATGCRRIELALERSGQRLGRTRDAHRAPRVVEGNAAVHHGGRQAMQRRIRGIVPNPKRPGTLSHVRFAVYQEGMTIEEYMAIIDRIQPHVSRTRCRKDVYYDRDHGYIRLEEL